MGEAMSLLRPLYHLTLSADRISYTSDDGTKVRQPPGHRLYCARSGAACCRLPFLISGKATSSPWRITHLYQQVLHLTGLFRSIVARCTVVPVQVLLSLFAPHFSLVILPISTDKLVHRTDQGGIRQPNRCRTVAIDGSAGYLVGIPIRPHDTADGFPFYRIGNTEASTWFLNSIQSVWCSSYIFKVFGSMRFTRKTVRSSLSGNSRVLIFIPCQQHVSYSAWRHGYRYHRCQSRTMLDVKRCNNLDGVYSVLYRIGYHSQSALMHGYDIGITLHHIHTVFLEMLFLAWWIPYQFMVFVVDLRVLPNDTSASTPLIPNPAVDRRTRTLCHWTLSRKHDTRPKTCHQFAVLLWYSVPYRQKFRLITFGERCLRQLRDAFRPRWNFSIVDEPLLRKYCAFDKRFRLLFVTSTLAHFYRKNSLTSILLALVSFFSLFAQFPLLSLYSNFLANHRRLRDKSSAHVPWWNLPVASLSTGETMALLLIRKKGGVRSLWKGHRPL